VITPYIGAGAGLPLSTAISRWQHGVCLIRASSAWLAALTRMPREPDGRYYGTSNRRSTAVSGPHNLACMLGLAREVRPAPPPPPRRSAVAPRVVMASFDWERGERRAAAGARAHQELFKSEGHADHGDGPPDTSGPEDLNMALSLRRPTQVKYALCGEACGEHLSGDRCRGRRRPAGQEPRRVPSRKRRRSKIRSLQ